MKLEAHFAVAALCAVVWPPGWGGRGADANDRTGTQRLAAANKATLVCARRAILSM